MTKDDHSFDWVDASSFWRQSIKAGVRWAILGEGIWGMLGLLDKFKDRVLWLNKIEHLPPPRGAEDWILGGVLIAFVAFAKGTYETHRVSGIRAGNLFNPPVVKLIPIPETSFGKDHWTLGLHVSDAPAYDVTMPCIGRYGFHNLPEISPGKSVAPFQADSHPSPVFFPDELRNKKKEMRYDVVVTYSDKALDGARFKSPATLIVRADKSFYFEYGKVERC